MREIALADDFLDSNFLSNELRVPVTLLETNACSPLATNAIAGDIWNDFSSSSYKSLPSVGSVTVHHPRTGEPKEYAMPAGGRGYTRPASLISLWSTAPFLLNNTIGRFMWTGRVADRMASFDDGIRQLLWPETRQAGDPEYGATRFITKSGKMAPGLIDRTEVMSSLSIPKGFLGKIGKVTGDLSIGDFPKGTPVGLLANVDFQQVDKLIELVPTLIRDFKKLPLNPTNEKAREVLENLIDPLLSVSKCPDLVVNRGHYFGTDFLPEGEGEPGLVDEDKEALIAYLKRM
jgi:hypothetical protein